MQWYRSGHNEHDWKSCCRQNRHESSNLSHCAKIPQPVRVAGFLFFVQTQQRKQNFTYVFSYRRLEHNSTTRVLRHILRGEIAFLRFQQAFF